MRFQDRLDGSLLRETLLVLELLLKLGEFFQRNLFLFVEDLADALDFLNLEQWLVKADRMWFPEYRK